MPRRSAGQTASLFKRAALQGQRASVAFAEWHIAGNCSRPRPRSVYGQQSRSAATGEKFHGHEVLLWVRCRRCDKCRAYKRYHWQQRATYEVVNSAGRTWFLTLTMSHENHLRMQYSLREWDTWTDEVQEARLIARELKEVTKALKRLRKASGSFRYLLATEQHKSGFPHFHMLLHESEPGQFTSRQLSGDLDKPPRWWGFGFVHARLTDGLAGGRARYVTKYIAKDITHRVRASQQYGKVSQSLPFSLSGRFPPERGGRGGLSSRQRARRL